MPAGIVARRVDLALVDVRLARALEGLLPAATPGPRLRVGIAADEFAERPADLAVNRLGQRHPRANVVDHRGQLVPAGLGPAITASTIRSMLGRSRIIL
jgi:hypothetical protein